MADLYKWVNKTPSLVKSSPSTTSKRVETIHRSDIAKLIDSSALNRYGYYCDHADEYPEEFAMCRDELIHHMRRLGVVHSVSV